MIVLDVDIDLQAKLFASRFGVPNSVAEGGRLTAKDLSRPRNATSRQWGWALMGCSAPQGQKRTPGRG